MNRQCSQPLDHISTQINTGGVSSSKIKLKKIIKYLQCSSFFAHLNSVTLQTHFLKLLVRFFEVIVVSELSLRTALVVLQTLRKCLLQIIKTKILIPRRPRIHSKLHKPDSFHDPLDDFLSFDCCYYHGCCCYSSFVDCCHGIVEFAAESDRIQKRNQHSTSYSTIKRVQALTFCSTWSFFAESFRSRCWLLVRLPLLLLSRWLLLPPCSFLDWLDDLLPWSRAGLLRPGVVDLDPPLIISCKSAWSRCWI